LSVASSLGNVSSLIIALVNSRRARLVVIESRPATIAPFLRSAMPSEELLDPRIETACDIAMPNLDLDVLELRLAERAPAVVVAPF